MLKISTYCKLLTKISLIKNNLIPKLKENIKHLHTYTHFKNWMFKNSRFSNALFYPEHVTTNRSK